MNIQTEIAAKAVTEHLTTISVGNRNDESFEFTFRMDGTGSCSDLDCGGDPIAFTWEREQIEGLEGEELAHALQNMAGEIFWEEINDQLGEERVIDDLDFGSEKVTFETGSSEELERIVRLALYCFPSIWHKDRESVEVAIDAGTEDGESRVDEYCELMSDAEIPEAVTSTIHELVDYALGWNSPAGSHLEYNDGAPGRASGYSEYPNTVAYTIPRPSFHELAEARAQLLETFADHESHEQAEALLRGGD